MERRVFIMNEPDWDAPFEVAVERERIAYLFEHLPFALISNFVISSGLVLMLWGSGQQAALVLWLGAIALLSWVRWRLGLRFRFQHQQAAGFDAVRWGHLYTLTVFLSASLLGFASLWFFPQGLLALGELALVLVIMSIGSIVLHAVYRQAHVVYVLCVLFPFALHCILSPELFQRTLGIVVLLFIPINFYLSRKIGISTLQSIVLRLRNQDLIKALTLQKEIAETARNEAEQATRAKTRFIATASHDLRQPVMALEFFSESLVHELQAHPGLKLADSIRSTGRNLGDLLDALLDVSQVDASVVRPVKQDFPVTDMIHRLNADFSLQAAAQGLRCRAVSSSAWIHSDPMLLERIVRNLMSNAIKYTRTGSILLGCRRVGSGLRIEVHDTGIGIPQDQQKSIFDEFTQLDNPQRDQKKGLGLGLAIVDNLAKALGHPLSLRSRPQQGSVFGVTVPLAVLQPAPAAAQQSR